MINTIKRYFFFILALLLLSGNLSTVEATRYPNEGNLIYDGGLFAFSGFIWTTEPGPWTVEKPGYEHDLIIKDKNFFIGNLIYNCTTFTNLPAGYDDCNTAGTLDPDNERVFSFGSFRANWIKKDTEYFGSWNFDLYAGAPSATVILRAQEVENRCSFPFGGIWCMDGTGEAEVLHTDVMTWQGTTTEAIWEVP